MPVTGETGRYRPGGMGAGRPISSEWTTGLIL